MAEVVGDYGGEVGVVEEESGGGTTTVREKRSGVVVVVVCAGAAGDGGCRSLSDMHLLSFALSLSLSDLHSSLSL